MFAAAVIALLETYNPDRQSVVVASDRRNGAIGQNIVRIVEYRPAALSDAVTSPAEHPSRCDYSVTLGVFRRDTNIGSYL